MTRPLLATAAFAVVALTVMISVDAARAHEERCVCSEDGVPPVPPAPPLAPLPPIPPIPPVPPSESHRHAQLERQVVIINADAAKHLRRVRRIIHVREVANDDDHPMTRKEFIQRAERAFDEHDTNHDGVLDEDERDGMVEAPDEPDEVEAPEPPDTDD